MLTHLREEGSSGTGMHRMLVSQAEPREMSSDVTNDYNRSINPLWSPSPQRKDNVDQTYDTDSPVTTPPEPRLRPGRQATHPSSGFQGQADDLSLLQQPVRDNMANHAPHPASKQQSQGSSHRYPTRQQHSQQKTAFDSVTATRHKHGRTKSNADSQPASKRRVTDSHDDPLPVQLRNGSGTGAQFEWPAGPQRVLEEALQDQPQEDRTRRESSMPAHADENIAQIPNVPPAGAPDAFVGSIRYTRPQALHSSGQNSTSIDSSPDRDQQGKLSPDAAIAAPSSLPVSQPAAGASAVRHARDRAMGTVACQSQGLSKHVPRPDGQDSMLHPLHDFWPVAYDSSTLVSWVEGLLSWKNPHHSGHALLLALYVLYVMKRLVQQVSFAPMSVVSGVALAAVVRHGVAMTLPTIRERARAFQQQAQRFKEEEDNTTPGLVEGCLQAAAAIACQAYDAVEATAAQQTHRPAAIGWGGETNRGGSAAEARPGMRIEGSEVAKAALLLLHRATACETPSGTCVTAAALWGLLLLSEASVVSQWTVAMVACGACFSAMPLLAEFGDVLDRFAGAVLQALPLLWLPGLRRKWVVSLGVGCGAMWCTPGAAVLRSTAGMISFMSTLLWQMQGTPAGTARCHQD